MAKVIVRNIVKFYNEGNKIVVVLQGVNFEALSGEFVCLLGPSGCGKTTILNIVAGLTKNYEGEVYFEDINGKALENVGIGYVFQTSRLLNWKTLKENVKFVLKAVCISSRRREDEIDKLAEEYLSLVGLHDSMDKYPLECSEGEKIRTSIARALSIDPEVLLMDEPFSHLDEINARKLRKELLKIWEDKRKTVVFVTHNALEAVYLADRIFILTDKPAKILAEMRIDLNRPREFEDPNLWKYQNGILKIMGL